MATASKAQPEKGKLRSVAQSKVRCPRCNHEGVKTHNSRDAGTRVVRSKECVTCAHKYKTWEIPEDELRDLRERAGMIEDLRRIILGDCKKK